MADREEVIVVTLTTRGENGSKYTAQIKGGIVDVTADTSENSFTLHLTSQAIWELTDFLLAVRVDPAAQPGNLIPIDAEAASE